MYKEDLALNNPECFICHKTQPKESYWSIFSMKVERIRFFLMSLFFDNGF